MTIFRKQNETEHNEHTLQHHLILMTQQQTENNKMKKW